MPQNSHGDLQCHIATLHLPGAQQVCSRSTTGLIQEHNRFGPAHSNLQDKDWSWAVTSARGKSPGVTLEGQEWD